MNVIPMDVNVVKVNESINHLHNNVAKYLCIGHLQCRERKNIPTKADIRKILVMNDNVVILPIIINNSVTLQFIIGTYIQCFRLLISERLNYLLDFIFYLQFLTTFQFSASHKMWK